MVKIAFSVDDVCPKPGYGLLLNNDPLKYLKKLNEEFGCKFTLFCIPLADGNQQFDWRNNQAWVDKMKAEGFYEFAVHGLIHRATNPSYGAQEFLGLSDEETFKRMAVGKQILETTLNQSVDGFKAPGWYISPSMYKHAKNLGFKYVSDHMVGNKPVVQNGLSIMPYTFSIDGIYHELYDDTIILHSHISTVDGNLNGWTEELYQKVREFLLKQKNPEYVFIKELV